MLFALMVMPRSRSRSMESRTCSCISRCVSAPVISRRRSASVDLPWSMCAMMQKFRMNFGSIFLAYQCSQLRAGFERPGRVVRRACCIRTSDTRSAKTVPYKQPVCHKCGCASAEAGAKSAPKGNARIQRISFIAAAAAGPFALCGMNLTVPQGHDGIDAQGAACGNGAGQKGHHQEHHGHEKKYLKIEGVNTVEQGSNRRCCDGRED